MCRDSPCWQDCSLSPGDTTGAASIVDASGYADAESRQIYKFILIGISYIINGEIQLLIHVNLLYNQLC